MGVIRAGLTAGLMLNLLGWLGNQLVLGRMWRDAVSTVTPLRTRTLANEILSLAPDFIYGLVLAWLFLTLAQAGRSRGKAAVVSAIAVWIMGAFTTYVGLWNSGLLPGALALATTLLALITFAPAAWIVARLLPSPVAARPGRALGPATGDAGA